jgi:RNA polymerase sigma factor (sigma-70 family)
MDEHLPPTDLTSLVRRAQEHDQIAFQILYEQTQGYVLNRIMGITTQFNMMQDIAQETWLAAFLALPTLQNPETFLAWIGRIATRTAWRLAQQHHTQAMLLESALSEDLIGPEDPLEHVLQEESGEALLEFLQLATPNERAVLVAFYLEELSIEEISHRSGLSIAAIKSRLHEGRKRLRKIVPKKGMDQ